MLIECRLVLAMQCNPMVWYDAYLCCCDRWVFRYAPEFRFHKTDIRARETELDSLFEEARLEMEQYDKKNG